MRGAVPGGFCAGRWRVGGGRGAVPGVAVTGRDREVLVYAARHWAVTAEQVRRRFFGDISAAYRRLRELEREGLLKHERVFFGEPGIYRTTGSGIGLVGLDLSPARVEVAQLKHHLAVVDLSEDLLAEHPGSRWITEREMRSERLAGELEEETGLLTEKSTRSRGRMPDGVLVTADGRRVAVEVERTRKELGRYRGIFAAYVKRRDLDQVRFYFFREGVMERAKELARQAQNKYLPDDFFVLLPYGESGDGLG